MPTFTAKDVQSLRRATGAGMMDAKRALEACGGDPEAAGRWLREQGLAATAKRAGRENEDGAVAVVVEGGAGAIAELRCETDFVAKSDDFTTLVDELAHAVAAEGPDAAERFRSRVDDLKVALKENIELGRLARMTAGAGQIVDSYQHMQNERGVSGVLVVLEGGDQELAHDVALHIAANRPRYVRRDDVPEEVVEAERATLEAQTRNEGKPEQALPKIVEGRLTAFFRQLVLTDQPFVKDDKRTVGEVLGDARVVGFELVEIGR